MTLDLHTHQPRRIRSVAEIATLPYDAHMTISEGAIWERAHFAELEQRIAAMTPAEQDAYAARIAATRRGFAGYDEADVTS